MTKTSAIFGVVSVLTAAIVGGVFIRKKIIDDALYWRAWVEAEGRWKREIRELEGNINELESSIVSRRKSKARKEREVEKHETEMKELSTSIEEITEKMKSSEHYFITKEVAKIVNKNFDKQEDLNKRIKRFTSELNTYISNNTETNFKDRANKLKQKISGFSGILESQKEKLYKYAHRRIELFKQFKKYKSKKEETEQQQKDLEEKLNKDRNLLIELDSLIKQLKEKLSEETLHLSNLKIQGPVVII